MSSGQLARIFGTLSIDQAETAQSQNSANGAPSSPGGGGWPQLGINDKGQNLTLVDALAAHAKDAS